MSEEGSADSDSQELPPVTGSHIWFLRTAAIFQGQTDSMFTSADKKARLISFQRGDAIKLSDGKKRHIYLIVEGQVKLRLLTEGGKEIILDVAGVGDVFGPIDRLVRPVEAEKPSKHDHPAVMASEAIALSKGIVLRFDFDYFQGLLHRRPTVVVNLTRILGLRQRRLEIRLTRLLYRSSLGKVAGLLSELGERYGHEENGTILIDIRLTHQEMASVIGIKRETVSASLAELEYQELIRATRKGVTLLKPAELDQIV